MNSADLSLAHPKLFGNLPLRHFPVKRSYFYHFCFAKNCLAVSLTVKHCPMNRHIGTILDVRGPAYMSRVYTALGTATFPTIMRRFMLRGWRWAVKNLTGKTVNKLCPSIQIDATISTGTVSSIRPNQTFVAAKWKNYLPKKSPSFTARYTAGQRIAVLLPTPIMGAAPAARMRQLVATIYRAYSGTSHFSTQCVLSWSERVGCSSHPARSPFVLRVA